MNKVINLFHCNSSKKNLLNKNSFLSLFYKFDFFFCIKNFPLQYYTREALTIDPDCLGGLVMEIVPKDSCLIFCSNRKSCENVAKLLTKVLFRYNYYF